GIIRTVVLTEAATACGMVLAVTAPLAVVLAVLLPLGVALNGTSSVLYATVADLVSADRRARAYALYYTLVVGASAAAPVLYRVLGDRTGPPTAIDEVADISHAEQQAGLPVADDLTSRRNITRDEQPCTRLGLEIDQGLGLRLRRHQHRVREVDVARHVAMLDPSDEPEPIRQALPA